jgi:RNA polymerase sigma-70 factor (ECF subfamily)
MQLRDKGKDTLPVTEKMIVSEPDENNNILYHRQQDTTFSVLNEALKTLNDAQKQCITLFYLQKKSYNEIAVLTGYTPMQIKSNIQNGKRNLKIIMEKKIKENTV